MIIQGMQLRHRQRPEWGIGTVTRVENLTRAGITDQRVWVRFPNGGLKTLLRSAADLEVIGGTAAADHQDHCAQQPNPSGSNQLRRIDRGQANAEAFAQAE